MKTYRNDTLTFEISYPDSWQAVPAAWMKQQTAQGESTSSALAEMLRQARAPFLFLQDASPPPGQAVPTVRCQVYGPETVAGTGGVAALMVSIQRSMEKAFPDYELLEHQPEYLVAGVAGARMLASMSVKNPDGASFLAASELLYLPTPRALFVLGLSGSANEDERPEETFREMVRSIRLR